MYARRNPPPLTNHNNNDFADHSAADSRRGGKNRGPPKLANLRILCLSEPERSVHPLELQEDFVEITRSEELVEIRDNAELEVRFGGNLLCRLEEDKSLVSAVINSCLCEANACSAPCGNTDCSAPSGTKVNFAESAEATAIAAKTANISVENEREFVPCETKKLIFRPFSDNRMGWEIKRKNEKNPFPKGTISIITSSSEKVVSNKLY